MSIKQPYYKPEMVQYGDIVSTTQQMNSFVELLQLDDLLRLGASLEGF